MPRVQRHHWRNGTVLAATQAVQLANFPLAQDVAQNVHKLVLALKPDVLQALKDNDASAEELVEQIGELLDYLDGVAEGIEHSSALDASEDVALFLVELQQLRE